MSFGSQDEEGFSDINITPFVDVVLVLLVIFMVTAPMMVQQLLEIQLPSSQTQDQGEVQSFGLAINKGGQFLWEGVLIDEESLLERLREEKKVNTQIQVIIAADTEAQHGFVIKALDIVKRAGIDNLAFQVEVPKENP